MDTSETYIKMCDCDEIQEQWLYKQGDWYWDKYSDKWGASVIELDVEDGYIGDHFITRVKRIEGYTEDSSIWLPRQDQLQILSGLRWKEFDRECLKYDAETKEQAGVQVVIERLAKTTQ